jgi:hypothetical protein
MGDPTGYGLGKAGWVTARFGPRAKPPLDVLRKWIDESYRAVAPAKLLKELDDGPAAPAKARRKVPATRARSRR